METRFECINIGTDKFKAMRLTLLLLTFSTQVLMSFAQPRPLRRADSFFGLHFDFHAGLSDSLVGRTLTAGMIDTLLDAVKPDYIQIDCKGHPGVTSYPTKIKDGTPVSSFAKNPLEIFRKVTKAHGVALYVHYSGVWDEAALRKKPEWAVIDAKGLPSLQKTSVHSRYVDELMIPQLKEVADYGVDGVWVDGDCWATVPDYSPAALQAYTQETGKESIPRNPEDKDYGVYLQFARHSFRRYVEHYVTGLHNYKPEFQVASNWAFSSLMPEPVDIPVDFMSGDLTPMNGVNSALFEARVLASQSKKYQKPWDLMSWSFNTQYNTGNHGQKSVQHLNQEAAEVIAMGGGYQCYFTQNRDASIRPHKIPLMAELAKFARARQAYTQGAQAIPQIALLYSLASFHKFNQNVYNNSLAESTRGVLSALMDAQYAVEVMSEHHLTGNMHLYPLIIIPEWDYLEPDFIKELNHYVTQGGRVLIIGASAVLNFKQELNFNTDKTPETSTYWVGMKGQTAVIRDDFLQVKLSEKSQARGQVYQTDDLRYPLGYSSSISQKDQGAYGAIYFNFGRSYQNFQSPVLRDFLAQVVGELFPHPMVSVSGSKLIHVTINNLKEKLTINLVNSGGTHKSTQIITYDEIPPLYDIALKINLAQKPRRIIQQPENRELVFSWDAHHGANVIVPKLDIHSVIVVE